MAAPACKGCLYYFLPVVQTSTAAVEVAVVVSGVCRRNPPMVAAKATDPGVFPVVAEETWCGEYEPMGKA